MTNRRRARDHRLLDALGNLTVTAFSGSAWRVVRKDRDPMQPSSVQGRWNPGTFDVLYASMDRDGACAEVYFHLSRQPVFPSQLQYSLFEFEVRTRETLRLASVDELVALGVEEDRYTEILYERTQEIGDAAHFMGFDGLIVPSARWNCLNLVLFTDALEPNDVTAQEVSDLNWDEWRDRAKS